MPAPLIWILRGSAGRGGLTRVVPNVDEAEFIEGEAPCEPPSGHSLTLCPEAGAVGARVGGHPMRRPEAALLHRFVGHQLLRSPCIEVPRSSSPTCLVRADLVERVPRDSELAVVKSPATFIEFLTPRVW